ncbi:relA-associated inhibitor [Engraulis encrasicolus]|uniref:relA-associated inhibitor n=1 Tax=Engraulis encrasicolus TaxID=184585 RepID=UPI002FD1F205
MASQTGYGSSMLFQTMNDELSASLATADELSREFNSLLKECAPDPDTPQTISESHQRIEITRASPLPESLDQEGSGGSSSSTTSFSSYTPSASTYRPISEDSTLSDASKPSRSQLSSTSSYGQRTPPSLSPHMPRRRMDTSSTTSGHHTPPNRSPHTPRRQLTQPTYGQATPPNRSPNLQRRRPASHGGMVGYDRGSRGSLSSNPGTPTTFDQSAAAGMMLLQPPSMESSHSGRQSPRRSPSPQPFGQPAASTLPRNFIPFRPMDESVQRPKPQSSWNESDLDVTYERKPHHTYDKTEWIRPSLPNRNWAESNLDGPPPTSRKDSPSRQLPSHHSSLPRNSHMPSEQPIISRVSIPPPSAKARQHRPIPLSVIMRLQNPYARMNLPRYAEPEMDPALFFQHFPARTLQPQHPHPADFHQRPPYYGEELRPYELEAELENLDPMLMGGGPHFMQDGRPYFPGQDPHEGMGIRGGEPSPAAGGPAPRPPRPLSPTRLQPVLAPQSQSQNQPVPAVEELLRIRAEIPRALKRRGSVEQSTPLKKSLAIQPNQYKQMINKLFSKRGLHGKGDAGSDYSSSSDGEEGSSASTTPVTHMPGTLDHKAQGLNSILRRSKRKSAGGAHRHARLSPLVLLLDGALVGELDTVQRAVQEMSNPSQPNDEGITALHNAICGCHYPVVDFLVRIGANVSAPDSHGWTPLHCAASCNDKTLCEYLVRSGAAVMAVTESDWATAAQKCDPYAPGYEECEKFLRGVEESMGVENSGVLYALWGYAAQAADELSFREGDMVTILQKPEAVDWWWASLCGREGFVPNNYFGLFPKVRPKTLC